MNIVALDRDLFHLIRAWNDFEVACGQPAIIDYDLSSRVSHKFLSKAGNSKYLRLAELLRNNKSGISEPTRRQMLQEGREYIYEQMHDIWGSLKIGNHKYGGIFKRRLSSFLFFLADRIRPVNQRLGPLDMFQGTSQVKIMDTSILNSAYEYNSELLEASFAGTRYAEILTPKNLQDRTHARVREFLNDPQWNHHIRTKRDRYELCSIIWGDVNNLKAFLDRSGKFGVSPFSFKLDFEFNPEQPSFHAWLVSQGADFSLMLNFMQYAENLNSAISLEADISKVLLYNTILHETPHMQNIANLVQHFEKGWMPPGDDLLISLSLKTVVTTESLHDEFIPAICPLLWGYADMDELPQEFRLAFLGRSFQKLYFGQALDSTMRGGLDAGADFLKTEAKYTGNSPDKYIADLEDVCDTSGDTFARHLHAVYAPGIAQAMLLHRHAGHDLDGLSTDIGNLMQRYHDSHTLNDELQRICEKYGTTPVYKVMPENTNHPTLAELKTDILRRSMPKADALNTPRVEI